MKLYDFVGFGVAYKSVMVMYGETNTELHLLFFNDKRNDEVAASWK